MITDKYGLHSRWTMAVESYRRSVDLYRQVLELRAQQHRLGSPPMGVPQNRPIAPLMTVPSAQSQLVEALPAEPLGVDALTAREREVACLIARGYTNAQIAEALVVTRGTVANHVAHILNKLALSNRTQLAAYVTREQANGGQYPVAG